MNLQTPVGNKVANFLLRWQVTGSIRQKKLTKNSPERFAKALKMLQEIQNAFLLEIDDDHRTPSDIDGLGLCAIGQTITYLNCRVNGTPYPPPVSWPGYPIKLKSRPYLLLPAENAVFTLRCMKCSNICFTGAWPVDELPISGDRAIRERLQHWELHPEENAELHRFITTPMKYCSDSA